MAVCGTPLETEEKIPERVARKELQRFKKYGKDDADSREHRDSGGRDQDDPHHELKTIAGTVKRSKAIVRPSKPRTAENEASNNKEPLRNGAPEGVGRSGALYGRFGCGGRSSIGYIDDGAHGRGPSQLVGGLQVGRQRSNGEILNNARSDRAPESEQQEHRDQSRGCGKKPVIRREGVDRCPGFAEASAALASKDERAGYQNDDGDEVDRNHVCLRPIPLTDYRLRPPTAVGTLPALSGTAATGRRSDL